MDDFETVRAVLPPLSRVPGPGNDADMALGRIESRMADVKMALEAILADAGMRDPEETVEIERIAREALEALE